MLGLVACGGSIKDQALPNGNRSSVELYIDTKGHNTYIVQCRVAPNFCFEAISSICPKGYKVIDSREEYNNTGYYGYMEVVYESGKCKRNK